MFGFPSTNEPWIRVAGVLAFVLGYYYMQCGQAEVRRFFELTVPARLAVVTFFAAFVILGLAGPILLAICLGRSGRDALDRGRAPDRRLPGRSIDPGRVISPA